MNRDIPGIARILVDSAQGTREAVHHLASLGHRHRVFISGPAASIAQGNASAIVAFDDVLAQGLLAGFNSLDAPEPSHLSLVGCDDVLGVATWPALTSVSNQSAQAGRLAFELPLNKLNHESTGSP